MTAACAHCWFGEVEPDWCRCQLSEDHDGPHRCCCGQELATDD